MDGRRLICAELATRRTFIAVFNRWDVGNVFSGATSKRFATRRRSSNGVGGARQSRSDNLNGNRGIVGGVGSLCSRLARLRRVNRSSYGAAYPRLRLSNLIARSGGIGRGSRHDQRHFRPNSLRPYRITRRNFNGNVGRTVFPIPVEERVMNLAVENISVTLGGKEILRDVSYKFASGKRTAIIGANGAGKSTLLKVLCLLNENFSGRVTLDGQDLRAVGRKNLAQVMAILPQERDAPQDTTVRQLVAFGRFPHRKFFGGSTAENDAAIKNALELTKLTDFENRQVASLSGGERQRAWLAMTLAQRPKILLLDEPTTYLDIAHQLEVMEIIADVNKKFATTIIMVLHDINHARLYSDDVLIIKDGSICAAGDPIKILTAQMIGEVFNVKADTFTNSRGDKIIFPLHKK